MAATKFPQPAQNIILTKLYRPALKDTLVRRQRLIDLLDSGRDLPLTLVMAPAGSGKTTLLTDWLHSCPCPSVWLSLDDEDSDLGVFLTYFIAAIRTVFPDACEESLALLQTVEKPPARILASTLINEIEGLRGQPLLANHKRLVLVLDDYHAITGQAVNALLIELLRHPPQTLRLVLATRSDPALPLANLRARGNVTEIRRHDLRFSGEETKEYLERATSLPVSPEAAASLADKTEGWITGLHLAVLNLRHITDAGEFVASFEANERYIMDYLVDEVLARQSSEIQEFLLKCSVLDRLCGPLCEAIARLGDNVCDGQACLEWLDQNNLFVIALDSQRKWYRLHHLFQLLLQNRLRRQYNEEQIADLHRRASAWYAENHLVEDSIVHALAAGDEAAAVRVVASHRYDAMNQERWQQIDRWLRLLPRRIVEEHAELLLLEAWRLQRQWRFSDMAAYLDPIVARIEANTAVSDARFLLAEVDALRSVISYYSLDNGDTTSALAKQALDVLPMEASSIRGLAWMYYGGGFQAKGKLNRAREILYEGLKEDSLHGNVFPSRLLVGICAIEWASGHLAETRQVGTHFLKIAIERGLTESIGWARAYRGFAAYMANDLNEAEADFTAVTDHRYVSHAGPYSHSAFGLAAVHAACDDFERAREVVASVEAYGLELKNTRVLTDAEACRAWLALKQGRQAEARHWAAGYKRATPIVPSVVFVLKEFILVQILLSQATPQSLREAEEILDRLLRYADSSNSTRWSVEALALQALLADATGDQSAALQTLLQAVEMAEPGGIVRVFVDLGPQMATLLTLLSRRNGASEFITNVLRAFPDADLQDANLTLSVPELANQKKLIEPLTNREMEILAMLAQRLTAKEIASDLFISDRTVKRHTANIYQKLGVNNRQQAVASAALLGILASAAPPCKPHEATVHSRRL